MALVTVFLWIATTSSLLSLLFMWTAQKTRWGAKLQEATDRHYLAEGILAAEVSKLKSRPWSRRWYSETAANGASLQGFFEGASYTGWVQDVRDPWPTTDAANMPPLGEHTDLFLKVKYPANSPDAITRSFFYRVVFRSSSPERPTAAICRRFAEVENYDPLFMGERGKVVAMINRDEVERERWRAESNVYSRELAQFERDGTRPEQLWSRLASTDGLDGQIRLETGIVSLLKTGLRLTRTVPPGKPTRFLLARDAIAAALALARTANPANRAAAMPRCLYAAGRSERLYGLVLSRLGTDGTRRTAALRLARERFEELIRDYPWTGVPTSDPEGSHPARFEAPHAYVPLAYLAEDEADPAKPAEVISGAARAKDQLELLRKDYPYFHLWGEDAITGRPLSFGPTDRNEDEVVWYLQHRPLIQPGPEEGVDSYFGTSYCLDGRPDIESLDTGGWGDWYYNFFHFNLTGSPSAAETQKAVIHFYWISQPANDPQLQVLRITQDWTEAGVTRAANPSAVFYKNLGPIVPPTNGEPGDNIVDITDLYKDWKSGRYPNFGIKLSPIRNGNTCSRVATSDNPDPSIRPKLVITTF